MSLASQLARWGLPFVVTVVAVTWLFSRIDVGAVLGSATPDVLLVLVPALVGYAAVTLWIESECLVRLLPAHDRGFDRWTAARVKAASYPLGLLHYALGAGSLVVLISRRSGRTLGDTTGIVGMLAGFDVGMQLLLMLAGVTVLGTDAPAVRAGIAVTVIGVILVGFVGLRSPVPLGPLEGVRALPIFLAARHTPVPLLLELFALRFVFAACFIGLVWAALQAFAIPVPLPFLLASVPLLIVVAMIPAVAGLGPGQVAFVEFFGRYADDATLLACSLALSAGLIVVRAALGLTFAREFTREAAEVAREAR